MTSSPAYNDGKWREPLLAVIGLPLVAVRYLVASGQAWPDGSADGLVHQVDHGVDLVSAEGSVLSLVWQMAGFDEFLSASLETAGSAKPASWRIDSVDVSGVPEWTPIVGHKISSVRASWHVPEPGCPSQVWALRFDIEGGHPFTIALGEVRDGVPVYLPDSVIVLFDAEEAKSYRITDAGSSAWDGQLVGASPGC